MADDLPFLRDPADSREAIMHATFVALEKHGYAGLSIQRIADEADLSKSTFYHHFDDKDDLLRSFVEYVLQEFGDLLSAETSDDPEEALWTFIDLVFAPGEVEFLEDAVTDEMLKCYVELRAQAARDEALSERFDQRDCAFEGQLEAIIRDGIEQGVFRDVDAETVSKFILTLDSGHIVHRATSAEQDNDQVRDELRTYLEQRLLAN